MRSLGSVLALAIFGVSWLVVDTAVAQQVTVSTPYRALNDSFFERIGTHWGFNYKGLHARFGGPNMAVPQFGGFDPNAGFNFGLGRQGSGFNGFFNFSAGQGYRQSFTSQTPSVTLTNGYPGFINDTSLTPFVMGFIPIVGGAPAIGYPHNVTGYPGYSMAPIVEPISQVDPREEQMHRRMAARRQAAVNRLPQPPAAQPRDAGPAAPDLAPREPSSGDMSLVGPRKADAVAPGDSARQKLAASQSSSAGRAVPSVAESRRLYELENRSSNSDAMAMYELGRTAEENGKPGAAKIYYNMAVKRATGRLKKEVQARLQALASR